MKLPVVCLSVVSMFAVLSCRADTTPLTQLMVVVDSDMTSIDRVRVRVDGMVGAKEATASDLDDNPLPRTLALVHAGGPLGPITVTAEGLDGSALIVTRRAQLSFVQGRNLMLKLDLVSSCAGMKCSGSDTCVAGGCRTSKVDVTKLDEWSGASPDLDAGAGEPDSSVMDAGSGGSSGSSGRGGSGGVGGRGGTGAGGASGSSSGGRGGSSGSTPEAGSGGSPSPTCDACEFDDATSEPHGSLTCSDDGVCGLNCAAGYTDADQKRGNGCEASAGKFGWVTSNFDPNAATFAPVIAESVVASCSTTLSFGSGTLPATVDLCGQQLHPLLHSQGNGAPDLVVLSMRGLTVSAGAQIRFTGSRPVLLVVYGDADIAGKLDVSAVGTAGAAGSNFACGPGIGGNGTSGMPGAGGGAGGGFGTSGGNGGNTTSGRPGGSGGPAQVDNQLQPLRGGCAGGHGGTDDGSPGAGGASGGALQLTVAGTLRVSGIIAAAGGGGRQATDGGDGGGGGGSGGALLLEASRIEVTSSAWIAANGGGGGAGIWAVDGDPGDNGSHDSAVPANGGTHSELASGGLALGTGANGAAGSAPAGSANPPAGTYASQSGGGGGGGGLGRVVLRAADCALAGGMSPSVACTAHP